MCLLALCCFLLLPKFDFLKGMKSLGRNKKLRQLTLWAAVTSQRRIFIIFIWEKCEQLTWILANPLPSSSYFSHFHPLPELIMSEQLRLHDARCHQLKGCGNITMEILKLSLSPAWEKKEKEKPMSFYLAAIKEISVKAKTCAGLTSGPRLGFNLLLQPVLVV